jgi:hypothetical protein
VVSISACSLFSPVVSDFSLFPQSSTIHKATPLSMQILPFFRDIPLLFFFQLSIIEIFIVHPSHNTFSVQGPFSSSSLYSIYCLTKEGGGVKWKRSTALSTKISRFTQNKHKISYQQWEFQVDVNCKSFQVLTYCGKIISLEKDTSSKSFMLDNSNKSVTSIYYCNGCLITFWGYGFDWQVTIVFFLK